MQFSERLQTSYFRNHEHKIDYPHYVSQGWQIGSGPVASACITVVNIRLAGSGMRWGSPDSNAVCRPRARLLSEGNQGESYWQLAETTHKIDAHNA